MENTENDLPNKGTLHTEDGYSFHIRSTDVKEKSEYFLNLFSSMEKEGFDICIPGIKGEVLKNILLYIYYGKIQVTKENIADLVAATKCFSLDVLLPHIKTLLPTHLSIDNCVAVFTAAYEIKRIDILQDSFRYVETHFEELVCNRNREFYELPLESLKLLLSDKNLRVENENVVWLAITGWIEYDLKNRLLWVPDLLLHLTIDDIDFNLFTEIFEHNIVRNNKHCQTFRFGESINFKYIFKFHQDHIWKKLEKLLPTFIRRRPSNLNLIACTSSDFHYTEIYVTYDENLDLWRKMIAVGINPKHFLFADDNIYMFGTNNNTNYRCNIIERKLVEIKNFTIPRCNFAVVGVKAWKDYVYVLGGISTATGEEIYEVEFYDSEKDEWQRTSPMFPVTCFSAVAINETIYVVGGIRSPEGYDMVTQRYDIEKDTWHMLPKLSMAKFDFDLVAYHEKLYVIGGISKNSVLKDVEVFDPVRNIWSSIEELPYIYFSPRAAVVNDHLIVYNNHIKNHGFSQKHPAVQWNCEKKCWENIGIFLLSNLSEYKIFPFEGGECMNDIIDENKNPSVVFDKSPLSLYYSSVSFSELCRR